MSKNTMTDLVEELRKMSDTPVRDKLIQRAERGEFHDFRSPHVCGKMYFVSTVKSLMPFFNREDTIIIEKLRQQIISGEYDEDLTDEDRVVLKKQIESDKSLNDQDKEFFKEAMGIK